MTPMDPDSPFAADAPRLRHADEPIPPNRETNGVDPETNGAGGEPIAGDSETAAEMQNLDAIVADAGATADAIQALPEEMRHLEALGALDQTVTKVACEKCGTKAEWRGEMTADMIERTFTKGCGPSGLPLCIHCGTEMSLVPVLTPVEEAARHLEADKAGQAARPQYQVSLPGILPEFDFRTAQIQTERLEEVVEHAEKEWDDAKEAASDCKKAFDDAVEALREHIQLMHRSRIDAEFQASRRSATEPEDPAVAAAADTAKRIAACAFEAATGVPCSICRNPVPDVVPAENTSHAHIAAAAVVKQANGELEAASLRQVLQVLAGWELLEETVRGWSAVERAQVLGHLETPGVVEKPAVLGQAHEAADPAGKKQACRVCGAPMPFLPDDDRKTWPIGTKVGTDCPGDPAAVGVAEPARTIKPRHARTEDRQKARQASGRQSLEPGAQAKRSRGKGKKGGQA